MYSGNTFFYPQKIARLFTKKNKRDFFLINWNVPGTTVGNIVMLKIKQIYRCVCIECYGNSLIPFLDSFHTFLAVRLTSLKQECSFFFFFLWHIEQLRKKPEITSRAPHGNIKCNKNRPVCYPVMKSTVNTIRYRKIALRVLVSLLH